MSYIKILSIGYILQNMQICVYLSLTSRTDHDIYVADPWDVNLFSSLFLHFKLCLFQGDLNRVVS